MTSSQTHEYPDERLCALVPVKSLARSKQRLKDCLGEDRGNLTIAMLLDVLAALNSSLHVAQVVVVTADPRVAGIAADLGAVVLDEVGSNGQSSGMIEAIEQGVAFIRRSGWPRVAIFPADIPLLTGPELDRLLLELLEERRAKGAEIVAIGPAKDSGGTNLLCFDTRLSLPLKYGPGSCDLHVESALAVGCQPLLLHAPALSLDIDEQEDLEAFVSICISQPEYQGTETWRFLQDNRGEMMNEVPSPDFVSEPGLTDLLKLDEQTDLADLCRMASTIRNQGHGNIVTYSRKVFIPLTRLCRDFCHYCTFATSPRHLPAPYMSADEAVSIAQQGAAMGCKEALFTLGEKPELRHEAARQGLADLGFESTLEYVAHVAGRVLKETGLLPHINAGCMTPAEIQMLRRVSASMGIMVESVSERLCEKGQVHYGSPDKHPAARLQTIADAGRARVPFTTGILIGIGETRRERLDSLLAIRELHREFGHIQEVIVQNFVPKADTKMASVEPPGTDELLWTIAMARIIFGPGMSIQAPPNLSPGKLRPLVGAGINDWGGVSPLTPDHVNPESPWPQLDRLSAETALTGKLLQQRLTIYPDYATAPNQWLDSRMIGPVLKLADSYGLAREDDWLSGTSIKIPEKFTFAPLTAHAEASHSAVSSDIRAVLDDAQEKNHVFSVSDISRLFNARGGDFIAVCQAADRMRSSHCGEAVSYVVNRNINYTNICTYRCKFCAFAKGKKNTAASDAPYLKSPQEVGQLAIEAWQRGATEVCLQGGIHPSFTGQTYIDICSAVNQALPEMHIHAFSPLEVTHGAESLGISVREFLTELKKAGLKTLPGTAAEILSDDVRAEICPDKLNTRQWLDVVGTAHDLGLSTTATIMFGHVDRYEHWATHLLRILELQRRSGGITEFVPLPFVADEAPIYRRGQSRRGPTLRESVLMHAVSRLVLSPHIRNVQTSWVKMGLEGAALCLQAGANDLGGTLMNESITRAAGASHGQEMKPEILEGVIASCHRLPYQRNTFYEPVESRTPAGLSAEIDIIGSAYTDFYGSPFRERPITILTESSAHYPASVRRHS
jgi:FO synthase